jgi:hypothetical protein
MNPDGPNQLQGEHLRRLVQEARNEFFLRSPRKVGGGYEQINSARIVIVEVYSRLSIDAQVAIVSDVMRASEELVLDRNPDAIFATSDTPQAFITDLLCELIYQQLMDEPLVAFEEAAREALSD